MEIVVTIQYTKAKTLDLLKMSKHELATTLRSDLVYLQLPYPPERNIRDASLEGITFFWNSDTCNVSQLFY